MKITLTVFVIAAASLYFFLYGLPELKDNSLKTAVLESGSLAVADHEELCVIRNETLYLADVDGKLNYVNADGTKVRRGVNLLNIEAMQPPEGASIGDTEAFRTILARAGDAAVTNAGNIAPVSALVSYYGDGYEKILTPDAVETLTKSDIQNVPANPTNLAREYAKAGDPVYKLTDNNLWYMIFWIPESSGSRVNYDEGRMIRVDTGQEVIDAKISTITVDENGFKVVLTSDMYYAYMTRYRKFEADILFSERRGIVIEGAWMVEHDHRPGLYVKQKDGSFKWMPILIKATSGAQYLIASNIYYDEKGEAVQTVKYYDEVLIDPSEVEPDRIITENKTTDIETATEGSIE
jgi:putative membrane fusion protein